MVIDKPGIYDVPIEDYHGKEICAAPSISASGLEKIIMECPAKFWWDSSMNDQREPLDTKALKLGRAAHVYRLEGEDAFYKAYSVMEPGETGATKGGKLAKAAAEEAGRSIISFKDFETIERMSAALTAHPFARYAFQNGHVEKTLAWQCKETGVWLRCRPDFLPNAIKHIPDYKTSVSAKRSEFEKHVYKYGYAMQAAHYLDGIEAVTGTKPAGFYFVVQEKTPPYVVSVFSLEQTALEWGRILNRVAVHIFAKCLKTGDWYGYEKDVVEVGFPYYAEKELQRQHEVGAFNVDQMEAAE